MNTQRFNPDSFIHGRIIGILDNGFVLQNEKGRIDLFYEGGVNVGDIVQLKVQTVEETFVDGRPVLIHKVLEFTVLTVCRDEFFIGRESPNYRRIVIDLYLKEKLLQRMRIIQKIREFFYARDFTEVDTPSLVKLPGMEPYLDVFKTEFVSQPGPDNIVNREDLYLITSPEYAMKKLLVSGYEKIFQMCKSFRNKETNSSLHNPEFTILEWYRAYSDYTEIMKDMEDLVFELTRSCHGSAKIPYSVPSIGPASLAEIDVTPPWTRLKVSEAFKKYAGIEPDELEDPDRFRAAVTKKKLYRITEKTSFDDMFFLVFMNEIELQLGFDKPVILYEYPASMAALSKKCPHDERYAERFEAYIAGMELCNAFTELTDPVEQEARLKAERLERQKLGKPDYPVDESFINALQFGMPPSGGIALGVDRLIMLLTNTSDIRDILFFPHKDL